MPHPEVYAFINEKGEIVIDYQFGGADIKFSEGLCAVWEARRFGFINPRGEVKIKYQYYVTQHFSEGLCAAGIKQKSGKILNGFIDKSGEWVIPPGYLVCEPFEGGLARVNPEGDKWGYINKSGEFIWKPSD
jgi:hypothetical protein